MEKNQKINKELAEIDTRLNKISADLSRLGNIKADLLERKETLEANLRTIELLRSGYDITKENSMTRRLYKDTNTVPMMERFYQSDSMFLILNGVCYLTDLWSSFSLVITRDVSGINLRDSKITITDLKKMVGSWVSLDNVATMRENERLYPLYLELGTAVKRILSKPSARADYMPFVRPCRLRAQIDSDRKGYGSIYNGDDLIHQGQLYGATTKFLIIGIRI